MIQVLVSVHDAGSISQDGPRLVGDILTEMLQSDSPLAENYRKFLASKESNAEKGDMKYE